MVNIIMYKGVSKHAGHSALIIGSTCIIIRNYKTDLIDKCVDARIVFVQNRNSSNWLVIRNTDTAIGGEEIISIL